MVMPWWARPASSTQSIDHHERGGCHGSQDGTRSLWTIGQLELMSSHSTSNLIIEERSFLMIMCLSGEINDHLSLIESSYLTLPPRCFDFAGQEENFAVHQLFISTGALFILVVNLSQQDLHSSGSLPPRIAFWLRSVQNHDPTGARVIIVGPYLDQVKRNQVREAESSLQRVLEMVSEIHQKDSTFPVVISTVMVSCTRGTNIGVVSQLIGGAFCNLLYASI